jgi:hypothetical protein
LLTGCAEPQGVIAHVQVEPSAPGAGTVTLSLNDYGDKERATGLTFYGWALVDDTGECRWTTPSENEKAAIKFDVDPRAAFLYSHDAGKLWLSLQGADEKVECPIIDGKTPSLLFVFNYRPEGWLAANEDISPIRVSLPTQ